MSSNLLTSLPSTISSLANLRFLDLSYNRITYIDSNIFENLTSLSHLNLEANHLDQSSNLSLLHLEASLSHLSLANNGLSRLPDLFKETFSRLSRLDLANNRLSVIPNTFLRNIPNLEELILDNNLIETIVLEPLPLTVRTLSLLGNKLRCDCKSLWLRRLLDRADVEVTVPSCWSPFSRNSLQLAAFE